MTLMHEHVVLLDPEIASNGLSRWRDDVDIPAARADLAATKAAGIDTLVDLTVLGMGRDVGRVRAIAQGTGLNVVVATGMYTFDELPGYFRVRGPGTVNGGPEPVEAMLVREIEHGIGDTGVRAGVIKVATDVKGLTPDVERLLRAAARAHRRTGVPISTHTDAATFRGRDQQRVFRDEGVDLSRVVVGHCGDSTDLDYLGELLDAGSYVGMDRFGNEARCTTADRIATVAELVRRGYAERVLLSHDATCFSDNWEPGARRRERPESDHRFLVRRVLPRLRASGVAESDITTMTVCNPRAVLAGCAPY